MKHPARVPPPVPLLINWWTRRRRQVAWNRSSAAATRGIKQSTFCRAGRLSVGEEFHLFAFSFPLLDPTPSDFSPYFYCIFSLLYFILFRFISTEKGASTSNDSGSPFVRFQWQWRCCVARRTNLLLFRSAEGGVRLPSLRLV